MHPSSASLVIKKNGSSSAGTHSLQHFNHFNQHKTFEDKNSTSLYREPSNPKDFSPPFQPEKNAIKFLHFFFKPLHKTFKKKSKENTMLQSSTVFLFFLFVSLLTDFVSAELELHRLNGSEAVCLDGSSPGYYLSEVGAKGWIVHLGGGGWCLTEMDCLNAAHSHTGSADWWESTMPGGGFLSNDCTENPLFCDYNKVVIGSCDGTSFSGYRSVGVDVRNETIFFKGALILPAVLNELVAKHSFGEAEEMLLSGCSSGGMAAMLQSNVAGEWAGKHLAHLKTFKTLVLSGLFPDFVSVYGERKFAAQLNNIRILANISANLDPQCKEGPQCFLPEVAYRYIRSPVFLVNSAFDQYTANCLLFSKLAENFPETDEIRLAESCTTQSTAYTECNEDAHCVERLASDPRIVRYINDYENLLENTTKFAAPSSGAFLHTCVTHCAGLMDGWKEIEVEGVSMQAAVLGWWGGVRGQRYVAASVASCGVHADEEKGRSVTALYIAAVAAAVTAIFLFIILIFSRRDAACWGNGFRGACVPSPVVSPTSQGRTGGEGGISPFHDPEDHSGGYAEGGLLTD